MAALDALDRLRDRKLHLLVPLHVLLQTRSVTQTAERLGTSPSAVSKLLHTLRTEFGDRLLVRSSNTMFLTDRARQLRPAVDRAIEGCRQLFEEIAFDLVAVERVVAFGANDYIQATLGVELAKVLRQSAPGVQLVMRPIAKGIPQLLADGTLDVCVGAETLEARGLRVQPVSRERLACVAHRRSADVPRSLTLAQLCQCDHVDVTPSGLDLLPAIFERQALQAGQKRNVVLTASSYLALPRLLEGTSAVAVVPARLLGIAAFASQVSEIKLRFRQPEFDLRMYWHNATHADAFAVWLRERIGALSSAATASSSRKATR